MNVSNPIEKIKPGAVRGAVKTELGVGYFNVPLPAQVMLQENGNMEKPAFLKLWKGIADANETKLNFSRANVTSTDDVSARLSSNNLFVIATRRNSTNDGNDRIYLAGKMKDTQVLVEVTTGNGSVSGAAKCHSKFLGKALLQAV